MGKTRRKKQYKEDESWNEFYHSFRNQTVPRGGRKIKEAHKDTGVK